MNRHTISTSSTLVQQESNAFVNATFYMKVPRSFRPIDASFLLSSIISYCSCTSTNAGSCLMRQYQAYHTYSSCRVALVILLSLVLSILNKPDARKTCRINVRHPLLDIVVAHFGSLWLRIICTWAHTNAVVLQGRVLARSERAHFA